MKQPDDPVRTFAASLLLLAAMLAGCGQADPEPVDVRPFVGNRVDVLVPAEIDFIDAWELPLVEWGQQTGAEATLLEYDSGDPGLSEQMSARAEAASEPDAVVVFPATRFAELASAGVLSPIPETALGSVSLGWFDVFEGLREKIVASQGKPLAVPTACPVLVCYYRADLLEEAGLEAPQTWQEYGELLATLETWAPGKTAVEPWSAEFRATMFLARAAAYAQHPENFSLFFDVSSGEALIDGPGFVRALDDAVAAREFLSEQVVSYSPLDCRRELLSGRAAIGIAYETDGHPSSAVGSGAGESADVAANSSSDRTADATLRCCRLPGRREVYDLSSASWVTFPEESVNHVSLTAFTGWMVGVSKKSDAPALAAWNLLSTLAADQSITFPTGTRSLCRSSQVADVEFLIGGELTTGEAQSYGAAVDASLNDPRIVAELPMLGRDELRDALTLGLTGVLEGTSEPAEALQQVARQWREIGSRIGSERMLGSYRQSLGLRE